MVKLYNINDKLDQMFATFNSPSVTQEEIDYTGEKFILALHKAPKVVQCLNEFRFIIFNKYVGTERKLSLWEICH